jgi:hypothetical protein
MPEAKELQEQLDASTSRVRDMRDPAERKKQVWLAVETKHTSRDLDEHEYEPGKLKLEKYVEEEILRLKDFLTPRGDEQWTPDELKAVEELLAEVEKGNVYVDFRTPHKHAWVNVSFIPLPYYERLDTLTTCKDRQPVEEEQS